MKFTAVLMHNKIYMPLDELIEFFDEQSKIKENELESHCRFAKIALESIKERSTNPDEVMTEEEFLLGGKN